MLSLNLLFMSICVYSQFPVVLLSPHFSDQNVPDSGPWTLLRAACVPPARSQPSSSTTLLSGKTTCSRLMFYFPCPSPGISCFLRGASRRRKLCLEAHVGRKVGWRLGRARCSRALPVTAEHRSTHLQLSHLSAWKSQLPTDSSRVNPTP